MKINSINHSASKRFQNIKIQEKELDKLIFPFNKHSIQSLEYKPFSRFSMAKSVDDVFERDLCNLLNYPVRFYYCPPCKEKKSSREKNFGH